MRLSFLLAGMILMPALAHAQGTAVATCAPTDTACIFHNDMVALGAKLDLLHSDLQALQQQLRGAPAASGDAAATMTAPTGAAPSTAPNPAPAAASAPTAATTASGPPNCTSVTTGNTTGDTIILTVSQDYLAPNNAVISIFVDGQPVTLQCQIIARHATARVMDGFGDKVTIIVPPAARHLVSLGFLNDVYGGSAATDRNASLEGLSFNGTVYPNAHGMLISCGDTVAVTIAGNPTVPAVVQNLKASPSSCPIQSGSAAGSTTSTTSAAQLASAATATATPRSTSAGTTTIAGSTKLPVVTGTNDPCARLASKPWRTLTIQPTDSIAKAIACAAPDGARLTLAGPAIYNQTFGVVGLTNCDIGGTSAADVVISWKGMPTAGKGVVYVAKSNNCRIHHMEIRDAGTGSGSASLISGLYIDSGVDALTYDHVMFRNNQNGCGVNGANKALVLTGSDSDFVANGTTADGSSHSCYGSGGTNVFLTRVHDYGSVYGNDQKFRVSGTVLVTDSWFQALNGRAVECPDGCNMVLNNSTVVASPIDVTNLLGNGTESLSRNPTPSTTINGGDIYLRGVAENVATAGGKVVIKGTRIHGSGGLINQVQAASWPVAQPAPVDHAIAPPPPPYASGAR